MAIQPQRLCTNCGTAAEHDADRFCRDCGTPLPPVDVAGERVWPTGANTAQAVERPAYLGPVPSEANPASEEYRDTPAPVAVVPVAFPTRLAASAIDLMLAATIIVAQSMASEWWVWNNEDLASANVGRWILTIVAPWAAYAGLQLFWVAKRGQTIGKRATRISVVDRDTGLPVDPVRNVAREMIKLMMFPVVGWVAQLFLIARSPTQEGIHDRSVGTLVVKAPRPPKSASGK